MTPEEEAMRAGEEARSCFESPAFKAACRVVRDEFVRQWEAEEDWRERDRLWSQQHALTLVVQNLLATASHGAAIQSRIIRERDEREAKERARRGAVR